VRSAFSADDLRRSVSLVPLASAIDDPAEDTFLKLDGRHGRDNSFIERLASFVARPPTDEDRSNSWFRFRESVHRHCAGNEDEQVSSAVVVPYVLAAVAKLIVVGQTSTAALPSPVVVLGRCRNFSSWDCPSNTVLIALEAAVARGGASTRFVVVHVDDLLHLCADHRLVHDIEMPLASASSAFRLAVILYRVGEHFISETRISHARAQLLHCVAGVWSGDLWNDRGESRLLEKDDSRQFPMLADVFGRTGRRR